MHTVVIVESGSYLVQFWHWVESNPIASLTAVMVCVTAYYAHATTKYVRIASEQFAAQIEPVPLITVKGERWEGKTFFARLIITSTRNDLVLAGGDILFRCEHGNIRLAMQLNDRIGDTISPNQQLALDINLPFVHSAEGPHTRTPSLEGFLIYKDSRNVQSYRRELGSGGITRIYRQRDLERLKTWMSYRSSLGAAGLTLWAMNVRLAIQKALIEQRSNPKGGGEKHSPTDAKRPDESNRS